MTLPFAKYSGCGNDFILIDNRDKIVSTPIPKNTTQNLCHRQFGIGADGIILLESSQKADFGMRIFNADGSEAEMCGNGIRCLGKFIEHQGIKKKQLLIETMLSMIPIQIEEEAVSVKMPSPANVNMHIDLMHEQTPIHFHFMDTGVPHAVIFVEDLYQNPYLKIAPSLRKNSFFPKGSNINLAKVLSNNSIEVRTFERGVEEETMACGTGAVAVALTTALLQQMEGPITIHTRSKDLLKIDFNKTKQTFTEVSLTGPAIKIFQGEVSFPN